MLNALAIIGLAIIALGEGWLIRNLVGRAWHAERELAGTRAGLTGCRSAADRFEKLFLERDADLRRMRDEYVELTDRLDQVRAQARARYEQREHTLLAQIQTMADRLAKLKVEYVGEPGAVLVDKSETDFFADETIPYSQDLHEFVQAIESEDARGMVEDFIEVRRQNGEDDAQILMQLERGEYR